MFFILYSFIYLSGAIKGAVLHSNGVTDQLRDDPKNIRCFIALLMQTIVSNSLNSA